MQFEQGSRVRTATERVTVHIAVSGVEPATRYGSKAMWRPESIRVDWSRRYNALGQWDEWHMEAHVTGSWLRKDGSRANREPVSDYLSSYSVAQPWSEEFFEAAEKTRPTHEPPAVAPLD